MDKVVHGWGRTSFSSLFPPPFLLRRLSVDVEDRKLRKSLN